MSKAFPLIFGVLVFTAWSLAQQTDDVALLARLNSPNKDTRHVAVSEMSNRQITSADVLIRLREISLTDPVEIIRNQAINALPRPERDVPVNMRAIEVQKIRPGLIAAAEKGNLEWRRHAIMLLPGCLKGDAVPILDKLADEEGVRDVVFTAKVHALPADQLIGFRVSGLKSPHPEVVDAAAQHFMSSNLSNLDAGYIPPLRAMESEPAGGLWASLILARGGQKIDRPTQQLVELLGSDRAWIRCSAAVALVQTSAADAFPAAITALGHSSIDVRDFTAQALYRRFFPLFEKHVRGSDETILRQEVFRTKDRPAALRGAVKKHGIRAAALYGTMLDAAHSERVNPTANKPLADAAVVALQELFELAKQEESNPTTQPIKRNRG